MHASAGLPNEAAARAQMFNAYSEMSIMVGTLSGFYKQRDSFFYPAWAASLPVALLRLPYSFVESLVLSCIIYWVAGLAPEPGRCAARCCLPRCPLCAP